MHLDPLSKFYTVNPVTNEYVVEIALQEYEDIFNIWDSSVKEIRDLNADLKAFLETCSYDIALNHKMVIRINVKEQSKDERLENTIEESIRNYFNYSVIIVNDILSRRRKMAAIYILISMIFLITSIIVQGMSTGNMLFSVLLQCLTVGGWIFLWEALTILFLQSSEIMKKRKIFQKLLITPIFFHSKDMKVV